MERMTKRIDADMLARALGALLLAALLIGSAVQLHVGLADNGDFSRLIPWVTSGPEGFAQNWPPDGSPEYKDRFYNNVLAFWKLDFPLKSRWLSSILVLWAPGVLANILLFSPVTLYLPFISLAPRALFLLFFYLMLAWIRREAGSAAPLFFILLGLPFVFLGVDTSYVAYFTSFYQEPASLIGLLMIVSVIALYAGRGDSIARPWISGAAVLFMSTAKLSNVHWALIASLMLIPWLELRRTPRRLGVYLALVLFLPVGVPLLQANLYGSRFVNAYQSIFCGALKFSEAPATHLKRLDAEDASQYIGFHAFCDQGRECIERYPELMTHRVVAGMILHEPSIAWRMLVFAADSMQQTELTHLDKHVSYNSPASAKPWPRWLPFSAGIDSPLNAWTRLKRAVFPTGGELLVSIAAALLLFALGLRSRDRMLFTISSIGVLLSIGVPADMWMQIFGDGERDLIKHLYLANICCDGVAILLPVYLFRTLQLLVAGNRRGSWMEDWRRLS